jgi:hypothetical protein
VARAGQRILKYQRGLCVSESETKFARYYGLDVRVNPGAKLERLARLEIIDNTRIRVFEGVVPSNPYM